MNKVLSLFLLVTVSMGLYAQDTYNSYILEKDAVTKELARGAGKTRWLPLCSNVGASRC